VQNDERAFLFLKKPLSCPARPARRRSFCREQGCVYIFILSKDSFCSRRHFTTIKILGTDRSEQATEQKKKKVSYTGCSIDSDDLFDTWPTLSRWQVRVSKKRFFHHSRRPQHRPPPPPPNEQFPNSPFHHWGNFFSFSLQSNVSCRNNPSLLAVPVFFAALAFCSVPTFCPPPPPPNCRVKLLFLCVICVTDRTASKFDAGILGVCRRFQTFQKRFSLSRCVILIARSTDQNNRSTSRRPTDRSRNMWSRLTNGSSPLLSSSSFFSLFFFCMYLLLFALLVKDHLLSIV